MYSDVENFVFEKLIVGKQKHLKIFFNLQSVYKNFFLHKPSLKSLGLVSIFLIFGF